MYERFFNLKKKPFELVPDPEFIYLSRAHKKALTYLDYGIRERAGFILLTGDVGSGKTTLIRDLLSKRYERVVVSKVFNTRVSSEQLLAMINEDFGLNVAGKDKIALIRDLNDFLLEQYAAGNHPILIIDEAQNLAADLLEEIRMLSNLESGSSKLLQIVLVGQPELRETLAAPELMQLRQRISINCNLKPLCREETGDYIVHRMTVAGNGEALEFPAETVDLVYHYSRGVPRLINIICDFLMLSAFAEEVTRVSPEMTRDVVGDLDFDRHFWGEGGSRQPLPVPAGGAQAGAGAAPAAGCAGAAPVPAAIDPEALVSQVAEQLSKMLQEVNGALSSLRQDFTNHVAKGDADFNQLSRNMASMSMILERLRLQNSRPAEQGLIRRLFGEHKQ